MQDAEPAAGEQTGLLSMLTLVEALSRALTTTQVAEAVFRHVLPAIGAAAGTLVLRADERDALELVGAVGHSQATLEAFRRIPLDASTPAAEVIRTRQPLWIGSLAVSGAGSPYFAERSTRQRYQDPVQGLDAIVWAADAATFQFTFISQPAEDILGYPVERWLTEPHFWADHIVPDDREWAVNYCVSCTTAAENHEFEYRLQAADGRLVWMRDIVHVVTDPQRRPVLLRGGDGRHHRAQARRGGAGAPVRVGTHPRAAAEAAISARDEFVAVVSHDLRNPLTAVRGHIQMVRRRAARGEIPTAEQLVERLNTIESSVMALSAQIDELQDATRLQSGRPLDLVRRPTDLVAVAREGVQKLQHTSDAHRLGFETAVPALVGTWDAGRLARVIGNLLSNAIKYSPAGGDIKVAVAREGTGGSCPSRITAWASRRRICRTSSSATVAPATSPAGSPARAWGWPAPRDIVEQHGGTIAVRSVEGRGTTFLVRLPLDDTGLPDGGADPTGGHDQG